ncbi:MAG: hypothetical protein CO030_02795 [Candidatus Magasanikbacteria bacterium CG_4_9_14_0_2_um_filter_42_11]|uniref:Peptidase S24/S26A/S26B/S26C domain-containing protein n=1 Tax=Candidatus Magasanikbacteria bacterium CG_4_9_14_0_2_um_filter_42_11 TaxID=1974643 RepID=A0A2M8F9L9_9BACT|nr:MAG: hypothetical protein COU34_02295 [Candidatus Magasanikbacteria bacterium CG10_big_fil_rev_8_21_14_0_10_43_9]PIY92100.1 MAG: hypothetical protein COY70_04995 [Candidatus Magasanikbacteria bacterium CG_4_10_14_0_8_um_filter_42_12]PJC52432.1 MAG: hypothetical protein CO030_02795 [Candidatus Magasanikbacteria bacterium CG_4_9_14_0_2_um_filter_42_11]
MGDRTGRNMNAEIPKATLTTKILSYIGLLQRNTVTGDSMLPLLHDGDRIFSKKSDSLKTGDIVVAKHPFRKKEIVKQIASIQAEKIELQSLNLDGSEDSRVFGSVERKDVLRVVVAKK